MLNIVMEYAAGGTLHTLIRKSGAGRVRRVRCDLWGIPRGPVSAASLVVTAVAVRSRGPTPRRFSRQPQGLPEPQIWTLFIQALAGLAHIHARKIIHRDIKTLNLFLDGRGNVKASPQSHGSIHIMRMQLLGCVPGPAPCMHGFNEVQH